jgi:predicted SAM-dependent methyltransferase
MSKQLKTMIRGTPVFPFMLAFRARFFQTLSHRKWRDLRRQERILLELGSGRKSGENGWTTVDFSGADIFHDLRKGIPLPLGSVDRIYTSHMFEHITYKELIVFINECFRVLKPGGELSVCVPDAGRYIRAYVEGMRFRPQGEGYMPAIVDTDSLIDQVNYIAYMDQQHKYMFDSENLVNTLKKAPFRKVVLREFDEGLDLKSRDFESIYASAIK